MNIFENNIPEIEKKIGYTFRDKSLLRQAFTRGSFCNEINKREKENYKSNEVLEFFGDSVLSAAIVTALIKQKTKRYPHGINTDLNEGDFSNIRSKLADKKNLSDNISRLGLEEYLIMGEGDKKLEIWRERSVREDLFEALIGAIYIDSNLTRVRSFHRLNLCLTYPFISQRKDPYPRVPRTRFRSGAPISAAVYRHPSISL
jgi:ribonuclease-3